MRSGAVTEETFRCPARGFLYLTFAQVDAAGAVLNALGPAEPAPRRPTTSEEQRLAIVNEVRQATQVTTQVSASVAEEMKSFMAAWLSQAAKEREEQRQEAANQRNLLLQEQRSAAEAARLERTAESKKTEAERLSILKEIRDLQAGLQRVTVQSAGSALPASKKKTSAFSDDSSTDSDDEAQATDVDDDASCAKANLNWRERTRATPKHKAHLVAWLADDVSAQDFASRWARKLETGPTAGQRDVCEALALESIMTNLHRALLADKMTTRHVAIYAVRAALEVAMQQAQKLQMRLAAASGEALSAFDVELANVSRKCRRRATDFSHIESIAATVQRKHPKKKQDRDRRPRGGRRADRENDAGSAPSSRASSVNVASRPSKPP
jgi:hypothetical protein